CPMNETLAVGKVVIWLASPVSDPMLYSPSGKKITKRLPPAWDAAAMAALKSPWMPTTKSTFCLVAAKTVEGRASAATSSMRTRMETNKRLLRRFPQCRCGLEINGDSKLGAERDTPAKRRCPAKLSPSCRVRSPTGIIRDVFL